MEPPVIRTGRNCDPERPLSDPSVGTSRLLSAVNSRPLTPQMAAALESWGTRFLDRVWRPDLTSDLVSRFPPGSRLVAPDQVLAERLMYAISLVAWALGRTPKHALRVEGLGGLERAFALATAVRLLGAVPHLWANDVRAAVAEMAVAAAAPLPPHVLVTDVLPAPGMWWSWETEWSDPEQPTTKTQGVLLHPLPALNEAGQLHRSGFAASELQTAADGCTVLRPSVLGRFGDCYPEDFAQGSGYEFIARFLAFLNSPFVPQSTAPATRQARRWADRIGIPDLLDDAVRFVLLRREAHEEQHSLGAGREYRHRWLVSGHFRNQWYRSEQSHKVIWIAPYVKGPDNAPLKPTVYKVSR